MQEEFLDIKIIYQVVGPMKFGLQYYVTIADGAMV